MKTFWKNPVSDSFGTAADWSTNTVPGASDTAVMTVPGTYTVTSDTNATVLGINTGSGTTLAISGDSTFVATAGTAIGANRGTVAVEDGSTLQISGTFNNTGKINLLADSTQNEFAGLDIGFSGATLKGGGTIFMSDATGTGNFIEGAGGGRNGGTLVNLDNTIVGSGQISVGRLVNDALIEAKGSAGLEIASTTVDDSGGGTIEAADGSQVLLGNAAARFYSNALVSNAIAVAGSTTSIIGGTLETLGSGVIAVPDGNTVDLQGTIKVLGNVALQSTGDLTTIVMGPLAGTAPSSVTLQGPGSITLSDSNNNFITGPGTPSTAVGAPSRAVSAPSTAVGALSMAVAAPSMAVAAPSMAVAAPSMAVAALARAVRAPSPGLGAPSPGPDAPSPGPAPSLGLGAPSPGPGVPPPGPGVPPPGPGALSTGPGGPSQPGFTFNNGVTISGAGTIGSGNLILNNQKNGVIDATGTNPLIIDTGANAVLNAGTLQADLSSTLFIASAVKNTGVLKANGGLIMTSGPVTGSGSGSIVGTGQIEFGAASSNAVKFETGSTGELILDDSADYTGQVSGFGANSTQSIDLADVAFASATKSYAAGTLTVKDVAGDTAHIKLMGAYTLASFQLADDGNGGTLITDSPVAQKAISNNVALLRNYMASSLVTPSSGHDSTPVAPPPAHGTSPPLLAVSHA
jgi:hypothetical protein